MRQLVMCLIVSVPAGVAPLIDLEAAWLDGDNASAMLSRLPEKVDYGSIPLAGESPAQTEHHHAGLSKLSAETAARIVQATVGGTVVEVELTGESGYLVWSVETQLPDGHERVMLVDAGNGRILAARAGEDGRENCAEREPVRGTPPAGTARSNRKHWWQFWKNGR